MKQRRVNGMQAQGDCVYLVLTQHLVFGLFALILLTSCNSATSVPFALSPWQQVSLLATSAPHDAPALWTNGTRTLLAWPGEPASPAIRLTDANRPGEVKRLPLGRIPRDVSLFRAGNELLHVLWLDQTLPGQSELVGALIDLDGNVTRPPGQISKQRVSQYRATAKADGDLITMWVEDREPSSIYIQIVDSEGRPKQPVRATHSGTLPSLAFDTNGDLHVTWLESTSPLLWTVRYLFLPHGELPEDGRFPAIPIAVIRLEANQLLDSFALGLDRSFVYCLWNTLPINSSEPGIPAKLAGLSFPINDSTAVHTLKVNTPEHVSLRSFAIPALSLPSLSIGVIAETWDGQHWFGVPAAVVITPDGPGKLHPAFEKPTADQVTGLRMAATSDGVLTMGWTTLSSNGNANVFYSTTR